ncbi:MAG: thymidine kinase [Candidatus Carbobacillus altaicus]|nr:thymidine kinase [Candidatus Carbobacillus altaicus]
MVIRSPWPGRDVGRLDVIVGAMFSGKSTALIRTYEMIVEQVTTLPVTLRPYPKTAVRAYKHARDGRYGGDGAIVSHDGKTLPALPITEVCRLYDDVLQNDVRVVLLDEAQFFIEKSRSGMYQLVETVYRMIHENRHIVIAGLDQDFRGLPFGPMGELLAMADVKNVLTAQCAVCGAPATQTQRLIGGKPAYFDDPLIVVGSSDTYEPRCRRCHEVVPAREQKTPASF